MASEELFFCTPEIENEENNFIVYEDDEFNADTETNYRQFLKTNANMKPMVSTQKTSSQKLADIK